MTVEQRTSDTVTALDVATVALTTPEIITQFVEGLPAERLGGVVVRAREVSAALTKIVGLAETRMVEHGIGAYIDPQSGDVYEMTANARRVVEDVPGLYAELIRCGVSPMAFAGAISADGLRITDLRAVARDEETLAVIKEFFAWRAGPKHLKRVED